MRRRARIAAVFGAALIFGAAAPGGPHPIETNSVHCDSAPAWLTAAHVNQVTDRVGSILEWDIHKIQLTFYTDQAAFRQKHGYDDTVLAFTIKPENSVSIGPRVTAADFDPVFGHELVHVTLYQKYKKAVPAWLEEGLANYLVHYGKVDYAWLAAQPDRDVLSLAHPWGGDGKIFPGGARYAYQASQGLMEMIATHCDVKDLLQMSVGKKLQDYLPTLCGIDDLNAEFKSWVRKKAGRS